MGRSEQHAARRGHARDFRRQQRQQQQQKTNAGRSDTGETPAGCSTKRSNMARLAPEATLPRSRRRKLLGRTRHTRKISRCALELAPGARIALAVAAVVAPVARAGAEVTAAGLRLSVGGAVLTHVRRRCRGVAIFPSCAVGAGRCPCLCFVLAGEGAPVGAGVALVAFAVFEGAALDRR